MAEQLILYRIVRTNPPTIDDMRSYAELGIPLRHDTPSARRRARGISVFASVEQARETAQGNPRFARGFIAELAIPAGHFEAEQTGQPGHWTLWGEAHAMLDCVRRVEPV